MGLDSFSEKLNLNIFFLFRFGAGVPYKRISVGKLELFRCFRIQTRVTMKMSIDLDS